MSTVATLNLSVTATTESYEKAMKRVQTEMSRVELTSGTAGKAINIFAQGLGSAGGPVGSLASSMIQMGPALGAATGGFAILNHVMETASKNAQQNIDNAAAYAAIMEKVGTLTGSIKAPGIFTNATDSAISSIGVELTKLHGQFEVASNDWFQGGTQMRILTEQTELYRKAQEKLLALKADLKPADDLNKQFKDESFNVDAYERDQDPIQQMQDKMNVTMRYANRLKEVMNELPRGGEAYTKVLEEWRSKYLAALDMQDAIKKKQEDLADAEKKKLEEIQKKNKEILDKRLKDEDAAFKKLSDEAKGIFDATRNPVEKLKEQMEKAGELLQKGMLDPETYNRFAKMQQDSTVKTLDKATTQKDQSAAVMANSERMALVVKGAKSKQEVHDPAIEQTNQILRSIEKKFGINKGVVAQ
jgi:hypothetical protein